MICNTIDKCIEYLFKYSESETLKTKNPDIFKILVFHLHIGSKTSTRVHLPKDLPYTHNHEYTKLLNTLFNNPEEQFSPEFISSLSNFSGKDIHIHNIVILFDPQYEHSPELEGFKNVKTKVQVNDQTEVQEEVQVDVQEEGQNEKSISVKDINYNESIVHHLNDTFTMLKSSLEIIQVSSDVKQEHIKIIIDIIEYLSNTLNIPNLINIIDCTSKELIEFYALYSNKESNIHITRPNCLHDDKSIIVNPMITLDSKQIDALDKFNSVRWLNYRDDSNLIKDLKNIKDICKTSEKSFEFLTQMYKHTIGIELLNCIMKLWSRLSYTNIQDIYEDETQYKPFLSIKFNDITLIEFINYWNELKAFREFIFNNSCSDYQYHIMIYINGFVTTYKYKTDVFTLKEALQFEAFEIFRKLMSYCCEDACYIIKNIKNIEDKEGYNLLELKQIIDYLNFNGIHF